MKLEIEETLKVKDVIEILSKLDPEMEVYGAEYYGDPKDIYALNEKCFSPTKQFYNAVYDTEFILL